MRINTEALFHLRERSGHTRSSLAREAETSPGYITDIEKGEKHPSPAMVGKLARALAVPVTALLADPSEATEAAEVAS